MIAKTLTQLCLEHFAGGTERDCVDKGDVVRNLPAGNLAGEVCKKILATGGRADRGPRPSNIRGSVIVLPPRARSGREQPVRRQPGEQQVRDQLLIQLRRALPEEELTRYMEEGAARSNADAIRAALGE